MNNEAFEYISVNLEKEAVIKIWFDTEGDIIIPDSVEGLPVSGISENAFQLTNRTRSIGIPESIREISSTCFCLKEVSHGFAPVVTVNSNKTNITNMLKHGWEKIFTYWGFTVLIYSPNIKSGIAQNGETVFNYRKLNGMEVEIVKWYQQAELIKIPSIIDGLTVVSIGKGSFSDILNIDTIIVPSSVRNIDRYAFSHVYTMRRSYYSPDYYPTEDSEMHKQFCKIYLPPNVKIDLSSIERGFDLESKFGAYEHFVNDTLIITFFESEIFCYLTENGWKIIKQNDNMVLLKHISYLGMYNFDHIELFSMDNLE